MEEDADAGVPPDPSAAAAFEAAKAWVLPRVGRSFRLMAGTVLPPELLTAVMVGVVGLWHNPLLCKPACALLRLCAHAVGGTRDSTNAAAALQVLLMGEQDFAVYMQAQHGASSSSGQRTPAFPSLLDMNTLEDAAEDDPDFCSDVCSVLLAALSSRVKLYAPAEAAARSADATGSYRLQCAAQVTAVYTRLQ